MLPPNQTLGKPLKSQALEQRDQTNTEGGLDERQAVNGTSSLREKRDLSDCSGYLKTYCSPSITYSSSGNNCEKGRYVCLNYHEAVCKNSARTFSWTSSTDCNRNIYQYGYPRCFPKYRKVIIKTTQGNKCVWQTEYCSCKKQ